MGQFFYSNSGDAQSVTIVPLGSNLLVPSWKEPKLFTFNGSSLSQSILSLPSSSSYGASSSAYTPGGNAWIAGWDHWVAEITPQNVMTTYPVTSGVIITGCALLNGSLYVMQTDGILGVITSGGYTQTDVNLSNPCRFLQTNGTNLYTLITTSGGPALGVITMSGETTGSATTETLSFATQTTTICTSGSLVGVGNYLDTTLPTPYSDMVPATVNGVTSNWIGVESSTNLVSVIGELSNGWEIQSQVSGNNDPTYVNFNPVGPQVFVSNPTAGNLQVFDLVSSTLSLTQTIVLASCGPMAFQSGGAQAVVVQPGSSELSILNFSAGTWLIGQTITNVSPTKAVWLSSQTFAVGVTSGVALYVLNGSTFDYSSTIPLDYTPVDLTLDALGNLYACGSTTTPTSGYFSQIDVATATVVSQNTWNGSANSILIYRSQGIVMDPSNSNYRVYSLPPGAFSLLETIISTGYSSLVRMDTLNVFTIGTSGVQISRWGPPYTLVPRRMGQFSIYNGSAWTTTVIPSIYVPTACTGNPSGGFDVATAGNTHVVLSVSGAVLSDIAIPPAPSQNPSVQLGIGSLFWWNGNLYGASSIGAGLIQL